MPDSHPVFNHIFCPSCGAKVPLKLRAYKFHCLHCEWQDSLFQTPKPVTSPSPRAIKMTTNPAPQPSAPQLSSRLEHPSSQKVLLPVWLCNESCVSAAQTPPAIAPERSKLPLLLAPLAIASVIITGLNFLPDFSPQTEWQRLFSQSSPSDEAVTIPLEDAFRQGVNAAMTAATLTQSASTQAQWQTVGSWWSEAIALMKLVPADSPDRLVAEQKAIEYHSNWSYAQQQATQIAYAPPPPPPFLPMPVTNPPLPPPPPPSPAPSAPPQPQEIFRYAVNQAMSAASLTQWAETPEDWHQVAQEWSDAIALMESVPSQSRDYSTAQQKAQEYQTNLLYAQQRVSQLSP